MLVTPLTALSLKAAILYNKLSLNYGVFGFRSLSGILKTKKRKKKTQHIET
jgi:hypothetical protein